MSSINRVACMRIPKFPIGAVWLDGQPPPRQSAGATSDGRARATGDASPVDEPAHWDERALALTLDERVLVATTQAATLGVRHGMTIPAARAICAGLEVRHWDDRAVGRAMHRVTASCLALSPQVTPARPGLWWIGAHGLEGMGGEGRLIQSLLARAQRWHPDARVAVASSCIAAYVATWLRGAGRIVPRGGDRAMLAQAPLALLPMDAELRDTLTSLGLTTAGTSRRSIPAMWSNASVPADWPPGASRGERTSAALRLRVPYRATPSSPNSPRLPGHSSRCSSSCARHWAG